MNLCLEIMYYVQFWFLQVKKDKNCQDRVQRRATATFKGLGNLPCEGRWKEIALSTLQKRWLGLQRETHQTIWIVKGKLQRGWECLHKGIPRRGGQQVQVAQEEVSCPRNKAIFYGENDHTQSQPLQGCGGDPALKGFRLWWGRGT